MQKIACIIVTYNRKNLLQTCLRSISDQTIPLAAIYVIDNASTDGTRELMLSYGSQIRKSTLYYIRLEKNLGGAAGFYEGIKTAYDTRRYDAYWVMDDDGMPQPDCLKEMLPYLEKRDYIAPLVLSVENKENLAFPTQGFIKASDLISKYKEAGVIEEYACPFNGILYSDKLVKTIGFPKKEMFIWGDEKNYNMRAIDAGFRPLTILRAIHVHPRCKQSQSFVKTIGDRDIMFVPIPWKAYCMYRNDVYNAKFHNTVYKMIVHYVLYAYFFIFRKRSLYWLWLFNCAYWDGIFNRFGGHWRYMEKD